ncbi:protein-glutamate O-methyltransferase CheR [Mesobacterium sp. TK19101]|uniref:Chemotaxis protein methyltransferase n=1 Tax=Mesobacterium hydrothermale TaxID=3111907 RepID=A0ABU6HMV2_9RHOB|nr:protein-glutamate O-methyltransferase CheR [Mesobacterium sp. TK19101]MEC3862520.1 protein-glutamate O-methyltransferase CheR [Mesobacterium sp. TK19101]
MTSAEFDSLAGFVKSQIGLHLRPEKRALVESRLAKRVASLGLPGFMAYLDALKQNALPDEMEALSQALTTNVTAFFRESHHFQTLKQVAERDFALRLERGEQVRIWSAGCSTGAEPYSIAMTLRDCLSDLALTRVRILATDIDTNVLAKARSGLYGARETEALPQETLDRHFIRETGGHRISAQLREMVRFNPLNLIAPWPMRRDFTAVFCRNVVIYFDGETQARLWQRILAQIEPGGHLFIGHSERLDPAALKAVTSTGVTTYRKS